MREGLSGCVRVCPLYEQYRERDRVSVCAEYMKERERGTWCVHVCVDYGKGGNRVAEYVFVCL